MNYIEFVVRIIVFAVTLFLLLDFIVACEVDSWKAGLAFGGTALIVIAFFFLTKQHLMERCPSCNTKVKRG